MNKIIIPLEDGYRLVLDQNTGEFDKEVYIGVENPSGLYFQDLAIVRPTYKLEDTKVKFFSKKFEILVFADANKEDYTDKFIIPRAIEDDE